MIEYILSIIILLTMTIFYKCVTKPKKLYDHYVRNITKMGYKVHAVPFAPLQFPFLNILIKDTKEGDALKFWKTVCPTIDVIVGNSMNQIALDISHPDFIKDFYSNQHLYTYPKARMMTMAIQRAMGRGIPLSEGQVWKRKRRIINGVFNFDFIKSMTGKIQQLCSKAIKQVEETANHYKINQQHQVQYQIIDLTVRMFSSVILECFLGGAVSQKIQGKPICIFMNQLMADVTKQAFRASTFLFGVKQLDWGLTSFDREVNRKLRLFRKWGIAYIDKKVAQAHKKIKQQEGSLQSPDDIIEALVRAHSKSDSKKQDFYSNQQIFEEFSTFFVAGTDTTSHYLMMMIYYIAQNPAVQQKLRKQIDSFMPEDDYSYQNLKNFKYIDNLQKQTTRLYGPVNNLFLRVAKQDNILNGLQVRKGTYITIQHTGNHYSQKYFKDPLIFRPERWDGECDTIPPFALGGFSAGARTCIGKHLVYIQSKIGLIKFMKRYKKIEIPEGPMKMVVKFVYSPEYFKSKMIIDEPKSE